MMLMIGSPGSERADDTVARRYLAFADATTTQIYTVADWRNTGWTGWARNSFPHDAPNDLWRRIVEAAGIWSDWRAGHAVPGRTSEIAQEMRWK
jgi:hypothetical protein